MTPEEQVQSTVLTVFEEFARDAVSDIQDRLNTDYPPASTPGESPHRRTGDLRGGIDYLATVEGDTITLTITSTMPYSAALEFGAPSRNLAPRPFMIPFMNDWAPVLAQRLQDAFSGPSPVVSPAGAIFPTSYAA